MAEWPRQSPPDVALRGACPRCGRGRLFDGLLTVVDRCPMCDLDLRGNDVGDGPAVSPSDSRTVRPHSTTSKEPR